MTFSFKRLMALLFFCLSMLGLIFLCKTAFAQSGGWVGTYLSLRPSTLPSSCHLGDLRFDTSTSQLEFCDNSNNWTPFVYSASGVLSVPKGGTGDATLTAHGVMVGEGTSAVTVTSAGAVGSLLAGAGGSSDPAFSVTPTLGNPGSTAGTLSFSSTSNSNTVKIQTAGVGSSFNFNLPASAGTSGQPLLSGGGGSTNQTYGTLSTGAGGTGVTSVPTSASATAFAAWDTNSNLFGNNVLMGYATTATAAGTTTLTVASARQQYFTGSTTQTVKLPVVSTLVLGMQFEVVNNSSGAVTVQSSGSNTVQLMAASSVATFTVISTAGTDATSWSTAYSTAAAGGGSVTSVAMTVPSFLSISGSPVTSSGTLAVSLSGTALPTANGGTGQTSLNSTVFTTLFETIATTGGDLIYGGASGAPTRLANGTAGQVLQSAGSTSAPTWSSSIGPTTGMSVVGTNTNNNAATGIVGEFVSANPSVDVTPGSSGTVVNFTSISLTAGDWEVDGTVSLATGGTSAISQLSAFVTLTSATIDSAAQGAFFQDLRGSYNASSTYLFPVGTRRISIGSTTTVYLAGTIVYSVLGGAVFNHNGIVLRARRVR